MARRSTLVARGGSAMAGAGFAALVAFLAAVCAVNPAAGVACVAPLTLAAVAAVHWAATKRIAAIAGRVAGVLAAVFVTAVAPTVAALGAGATVVAAATWRYRRRAAVHARVAAVPGAVAGAVLLAGAAAMWPATVLLVTVVAAIVLLAWRRPVLGFGAAVLLFAFEGSVKMLLGLEDTPLPGTKRAAGAAALDLAMFASIAGVLLRDRLQTPAALWQRATRLERIVIAVAGAWLALSVVQVVQGGDVSRGAQGFRLFQSYTLVAVAAFVVFADRRLRPPATRAVLLIGLVVSLYAAVRVLIGPADAERAFVTEVATVTQYGGALRAVGSFSSAIGLSSFLVPTAVFAFMLGLFARPFRRLAWAVGVLALVGLIGSYSRASLFGVALGLGCGLVVVLAAVDATRRRKLMAAGLLAAVLGGTYGGVLVASKASPALEQRASGLVHPLSDESVRLRFKTWRREFDDAVKHPLGQGLGAAGAASAPVRARVRTTDNSFLKILIEQGVLGVGLFVAGIVGVIVVLLRRLRRVQPEARALGLSALTGFVAFLGISFVGETVEQPGKIVAWGLLGIAAAQAFAGDEPTEPQP